jgi:hypothetical protein
MRTKTREPEMKAATMKIREITSPEEFNDWANRVNEAYHNEYLHILQDIFARSKQDQLVEWFNEDAGARKLRLFSIMKCMGEETTLEFVRKYARHIVDEQSAKEEARLQKLLGDSIFQYDWAEVQLKKKEPALRLEIETLTKELARLQERYDKLRELMFSMQEEKNTMEEDVRDLNTIKRLLRRE